MKEQAESSTFETEPNFAYRHSVPTLLDDIPPAYHSINVDNNVQRTGNLGRHGDGHGSGSDTVDHVTTLRDPNRHPPAWLERNLLVAKITSWFMFAMAVGIITIAGVLKTDLENDDHDYSCETNYIKDASVPWPKPGDDWTSYTDVGRYHSQCRLLYSWALVVFVAGGFSMVRGFIQSIPAHRDSWWLKLFATIPDDQVIHPPSRAVYMLRTLLSAPPTLLYLVCMIILLQSPLITGPKASDSYRDLYIGEVFLLFAGMVLSAHQTFVTGLAAWHLGGWRRE